MVRTHFVVCQIAVLLAAAIEDETCLIQTSDKVRRASSQVEALELSEDPKNEYTVDDRPGLGLRWEGVGAISGGGATSKLLMEYPEQARSDVLDYLFKPNVGLNLQILKVELGGDTDATEGAEPSHMHSRGDENYQRGYEWWIMKEAKARNPDIKLYALPWGWPGWLDPKATADTKASDPFAHPDEAANYTLAWLLGAKREHGLTIDYVGQWNERDAPGSYATALRKAVGGSEVAKQTTVLNRLTHYPGTFDTPNSDKCKQYQWDTKDGSRWVDEEGSTFDGRNARCLARCVNRNYISGCHTATFQWHLVSSFYDYLPWARNGVAIANQPWSGAFEITAPTWSLAHTSQFAPIGWRFAAHDSGVHMLKAGGSMVTRVSPDLKDFSVVLEKMSSANSACARGWNPPHPSPKSEVVLIRLKGAFLAAARRAGLNVWYSNLASSNALGANPPDDQMFQKKEKLSVDPNGIVRLTIHPEELYTLTTLDTGGKGVAKSPAATPFPIPYSQTFDQEKIDSPPRLWYDQMGSWEIQKSPYNDSATRGNVMRQVVPVWPQCWAVTCTGPSTYFGPSELTGDLAIIMDVHLEDHSVFMMDFLDVLAPDGKQYHAVHLDTAGGYKIGNERGLVRFDPKEWHRISIRNHMSWQSLRVDGQLISNVSLNQQLSEEAACDAKAFPHELSASDENEVMGVLGLSPGPDSANTKEACRKACCGAGSKCYMYLFSTDTWHSKCLIGTTASSGYHLKVILSRYIHASIDNFVIKPGPEELLA